MEPLPQVDVQEVRTVVTSFLQRTLHTVGSEGYVLGLSGGLDSSLTAALAVEAAGADHVTGYILPHETSRSEDADHAHALATELGIPTETVSITPMVEALQKGFPGDLTEHAKMNAQPRARMLVLYAHANSTGDLVLGTGNKSELLTGYFTKYGDGAADVYPIGDLYKTQAYDVARSLPIPDAILEKPPSAGLLPGQTDADELGATYEDLDRVLAGLESGWSPERIRRVTGLDPDLVEGTADRVMSSEHKRASLIVPKLGFRTPGLDWRLPRLGTS